MALDLTDWWRTVTEGLARGAAPGAACWVWHRGQVVLDEFWGSATTIPSREPVRRDTWWDLASLSKALATTVCALHEADAGRLPLDTPLGQSVPDLFEAQTPLAGFTPRLLLTHQSGLPSYIQYFRRTRGRDKIRAALLATKPERAPGKACEYSDLGFMLLGFAIEQASGQRLDRYYEQQILEPLGLSGRLRYGPLPPEQCAATELDGWRGHLARGEVHDENCAAAGGVTGHAGLFAQASGAGELLLALAQQRILSPALWSDVFTVRGDVAAERFWLGFKRLQYESGDETAFGHDGFTGTLGWVCPDRDLVVALLTNRVHPTRENRRLYDYRPGWIAHLARLAKQAG